MAALAGHFDRTAFAKIDVAKFDWRCLPLKTFRHHDPQAVFGRLTDIGDKEVHMAFGKIHHRTVNEWLFSGNLKPYPSVRYVVASGKSDFGFGPRIADLATGRRPGLDPGSRFSSVHAKARRREGAKTRRGAGQSSLRLRGFA
jgi:hypothetical protein